MCFFCCVSLRGTVYFMATLHMIGTFGIFLFSTYIFIYPPAAGYPDLNLNPTMVAQTPVLVAAYSLLASLFACFIFRAVDMDSVTQLKWSGIGFGVYQFLIILGQFLFSVMFGDLLKKLAQAILAGILVLNFFSTLIYLTVLFLYGKQLYSYKKATPKLYRNSLGSNSSSENNWPNAATAYVKQVNIPNLNFLQNHPPITRTNSVSISTNTDNLDGMSELAICTHHHHHHHHTHLGGTGGTSTGSTTSSTPDLSLSPHGSEQEDS